MHGLRDLPPTDPLLSIYLLENKQASLSILFRKPQLLRLALYLFKRKLYGTIMRHQMLARRAPAICMTPTSTCIRFLVVLNYHFTPSLSYYAPKSRQRHVGDGWFEECHVTVDGSRDDATR